VGLGCHVSVVPISNPRPREGPSDPSQWSVPLIRWVVGQIDRRLVPMSSEAFDRRAILTPQPRPEWVARLNAEGEILDIENIVPLTEESLLASARASTGLDDFGEDGWVDHFRVLLKAINEEARRNFVGRIGAAS